MTPGLRARKKEQTRTSIIGCALELFERAGFEQTTIDDIAEAANVSSRTFFRYFESKVDVILPHKRENEPTLGDLVTARPPEEGPIEAVHNVIRERLADLIDYDDGSMVRMFRVIMANPTLRNLAADHFQDHRSEMIGAFATRLHASPDSLGPRVLAAAFAETTWVILEQWVASGAEPEHLGTMIDEAFTLLRQGFG